MDSTAIDQLLKALPFFSHLNPAQLKNVRQWGEILEAAPDTTLFHEGDPASALYIILEGGVAVYGGNAPNERVLLSNLQRGDFFGELALAEGGTRTASVEVTAPSTFFVIQRADFTRLLEDSPVLLSDVMGAISSKMRGANVNLYQHLLQKRELELALERKKHKTVARLVTGVADEINTPLGILNALTSDLLEQSLTSLVSPQQKPLDPQQSLESLRLMQKHLIRLRQLLQTFRHVSAAHVGAPPEQQLLAPILRDAMELYRVASPRRLSIDLQIEPELEETHWFGYPNLLQDCLMYLMTNIEAHAYPADSAGPVRWSLALGEWQQEPAFEICVSDQGAGIAPEVLPQVCDPFFTTARQRGYRGLGLTIVKNLVENIFSGQLDIQSSSDQGTDITLRFPFQIQHNQPEMNP
ncbi:MAG: cyclic nucleotide-binding domain-containing protein [Candidatus Sericytochromatia bacterium]|nr:cyclic nucleotide-binding domain-containing protein [Candidatus Sericytochromatia bacterium]